MPIDAGPWRGSDLATWLARIAAPILREGETLPLVKPFPAAPVEEEAGAALRDGAVASPPGVHRPVVQHVTSEAELAEMFGWSPGELSEAFGR